jgi:hypothetical protein
MMMANLMEPPLNNIEFHMVESPKIEKEMIPNNASVGVQSKHLMM